ncbi:hypothetical protein KCU62_g110, partial [Aureobasidium sp. EXF-3399]
LFAFRLSRDLKSRLRGAGGDISPEAAPGLKTSMFDDHIVTIDILDSEVLGSCKLPGSAREPSEDTPMTHARYSNVLGGLWSITKRLGGNVRFDDLQNKDHPDFVSSPHFLLRPRIV